MSAVVDTVAPKGRVQSLASAWRSHPWIRFLVRRLIGMILVLLALTVLVGFLVQLVPGDAVTNSLGASATDAQIAQTKHALGLDKPAVVQVGNYLADLAHGDLGRGIVTGQPVSTLIGSRIGSSLQLAVTSIAIVLIVSIPLGLIAASLTRDGRRRWLDFGFTGVASLLSAIPDYILGTAFVAIFAVSLGLFPTAGSGGISYLVLPALAVSIPPTMILARIVRVETLNVMAQDYVRTARAKRLPPARILFRHVLPNALTAALTVGGVTFAAIIGATVVVENVFARPGLGSALVSALLVKDYPTIQGITLVIGVAVVVINALVDVLLAALDPTSRAAES